MIYLLHEGDRVVAGKLLSNNLFLLFGKPVVQESALSLAARISRAAPSDDTVFGIASSGI